MTQIYFRAYWYQNTGTKKRTYPCRTTRQAYAEGPLPPLRNQNY